MTWEAIESTVVWAMLLTAILTTVWAIRSDRS